MSLSKDIKNAMIKESESSKFDELSQISGLEADEIRTRLKGLNFKAYIDIMKALTNRDEETIKSILGVDETNEAYNMGGTLAPDEMRMQRGAPAKQPEVSPADKSKQSIRAMQQLGAKNLGGKSAQQTALAIQSAEQGKTLNTNQKDIMSIQAQNIEALASDPRTAAQFRNLLNKIGQGK
jgi:hypothetical protein